MVLQIGGPVSGNTVTSDPAPLNNALQVVRPSDSARYVSTLTQANTGIISGITGVFNKAWCGVKWIISKIFFCYDCTSVLGGKSQVETLTELKQAVTHAKSELDRLVGQYGAGASVDRTELREAWNKVFDALPQEAKVRLQRIFFADLARGKGLDGENAETYINDNMQNREQCNRAFRFFRNLEPTKGTTSGRLRCSADPLDEDELPGALVSIAESIEAEIAELQAK